MTGQPRGTAALQDAHPVDLALLTLLAGGLGGCLLAWTITGAAGLCAGHLLHVGLVTAGAAVLRWPAHLADPANAYPPGVRGQLPAPALMYLAAAVVLSGVAGLAVLVVRVLSARRSDGYATRGDLTRALSSAAAVRRTRHHRPHPSSRRRRRTPVATVSLGVDVRTRMPLHGSTEDSYLYLGPPRAGKGIHLVIPQTLAAPGAALVTATRPDTLTLTRALRAAHGPVAVFDPQHLADGVPRLRWAPQHGCADPLTAVIRGKALAAGARIGVPGDADDQFWQSMTEAILRCYLHAADLIGASMREVMSWTYRPGDPTPVRILRTHPHAAPMWAEELVAQAHADPRQRDSAWMGVRRAVDALAYPRVLDTCCPDPADGFDPRAFLSERGTVYLLGSPGAQLTVAPLISALLEQLVDTARTLAAATRTGRLDPPLTLLLDEAATIAPIPSLPNLLADGGGSGITTICVLQSLAQARARWGSFAADAMWDAATTKVVLGGLGHAEDLHRISQLAGEIDQPAATRTSGVGGTSTSIGPRRLPALPIEKLRTLPEGRAIILARRTPPVEAELQPWFAGPHATAITSSLTPTAACEPTATGWSPAAALGAERAPGAAVHD